MHTAWIWPDGTQYWFLNGKLHREDGPAVSLITHSAGTSMTSYIEKTVRQ